MDMLAYGLYRDLTGTIPYVNGPRTVFVKSKSQKAPYFRNPTIWMVGRKGALLQGETLPFLVEQNGWYKCLSDEGKPVWIFRRHAVLIDQNGFDVKIPDEPPPEP